MATFDIGSQFDAYHQAGRAAALKVPNTPPPQPSAAPQNNSFWHSVGQIAFHNPVEHAVGNFTKNVAVSTGKAAALTGQGVINLERLGLSKIPGYGSYIPVQKETPAIAKLSGNANPSLHQYVGAAIQTGALALPGSGKLAEGVVGKLAPKVAEKVAAKAASKTLGGTITKATLNAGRQAPVGAVFGGGSAVEAGKSPGQIAKSAGEGGLFTGALGAGGTLLGNAVSRARAIRVANPKAPSSALDNLVEQVNKAQKETAAAKSAKPASVETPAVGKNVGGKTNLADAANLPKPETATTIPKEGRFKHFISVSGELSRQGKSGQEIANRLGKAEARSETGQAQFLRKIPTVAKLKGANFSNFVDTLDNLSAAKSSAERSNILKGLDGTTRQAVKEWSAAIPDIRNQALKAGIDVGDLGKYYFPRNYAELLKTNKGIEAAAKQLVKSGQAKDMGEAIQTLQFMKRKYSSPFGHFENSRTVDLPGGYDKTRNTMVNYIAGAFNKIGHAEQFGPKGEIANKLIGNIGAEGRNADRALRNYQIATGNFEYHNPGVAATASKIRTFQRVTKLGLSSILNATQSTNTAAETGILRTAKAAFKQLSKSDREYIDHTGVVIDSVLNDLREQVGAASKSKSALGKVFNAPGFGAVEKFNRGVAAVAGRDWANSLAAKGDAKSISILRNKLGIEGDIGKTLTPAQQVQAGRKVVELTQFKTGPKDLPGWADSPMGKVVAQFRTFSYKQTGFVYNELIKEAVKGNPLPLARFIAVGVPVGIVAGGVRNELGGKPFYGNTKGQSWTKKLLGATYQGSSNVGGLGLGGNAVFLAQNAKSPSITSYVAGDIGGPTIGLVASLIQAGNNKTKLERLGLSQVPVGGPYLRTKFTPYDSAQQRSFDKIASEQQAKALVKAGYSPSEPSDARSTSLKTSNPKQYQQLLDDSNKLFSQKVQNYLNSGNYQTDSPDVRKRTLSNALHQARQETLNKMGIKQPPKQRLSPVKNY